MKTRADFAKQEVIRFPESLLANNFEDILFNYFKGMKNSVDQILLDLRHCKFIDFVVFQYLISLFCFRRKRNQKTYFGIPVEKKVRDFIRVWEFPNAFSNATELKFSDFIVEEDKKFIGEKQTTFKGFGDVVDTLEYNLDWKSGHRGKQNFFSYNTYYLKRKEMASILPEKVPSVEGRRWNEGLILKVLEKQLKSDNAKEEVGRIIIYESMSNAVRHPDATVIQAVSKFDHGLFSIKDKRNLRICIWDDGKSIVETLKPLIQEGKPIRSVILPLYMSDQIFLKIEDLEYKENNREMQIDQSDNPDKNAIDEIILQSSLFPGISRTVSESIPDVEPFDGEQSRKIGNELYRDKQGMGLYALMRAVLDIFQGSLFIRSGNLFMSMKVAHDAYRKQHNVRYKTKIVRYPQWYPTFVGNLLIIALPLKGIK
ncbi:MAG TPA: hypothetical protein VK469_07785 [Candidatus Kapabacteria bacterium]|nr:hypothetical protein [Candidatus Kapabacteria bacterium]